MASTLPGKQSGQRREHGAVWPGGAWAADLTAQHRHRVSEHADLGVLGRLAAAEQAKPADELVEDQVEESEQVGDHRRPPPPVAKPQVNARDEILGTYMVSAATIRVPSVGLALATSTITWSSGPMAPGPAAVGRRIRCWYSAWRETPATRATTAGRYPTATTARDRATRTLTPSPARVPRHLQLVGLVAKARSSWPTFRFSCPISAFCCGVNCRVERS